MVKNLLAGIPILFIGAWVLVGLVWFVVRIPVLGTWTIIDLVMVLPALTFVFVGLKQLAVFLGSRMRGKK